MKLALKVMAVIALIAVVTYAIFTKDRKAMDILNAIANEREQAGRPLVSEDPDDWDYDRDSIIHWYTVADLNRSIERYNDFIKKHGESWSW